MTGGDTFVFSFILSSFVGTWLCCILQFYCFHIIFILLLLLLLVVGYVCACV